MRPSGGHHEPTAGQGRVRLGDAGRRASGLSPRTAASSMTSPSAAAAGVAAHSEQQRRRQRGEDPGIGRIFARPRSGGKRMAGPDPPDSSAACSYRPKLGMMYVPATSGSACSRSARLISRPTSAPRSPGGVHRRARLVRDRDPGDLVVQELGVAGGLQRQDAEQDGHRESRPAERRRASSTIASTCSSS